MTTAVFDVACTIQKRVKEINILIDLAKFIDGKKKITDIDKSHYNIFCRSAAILISAHLEGFVNDLCKALIKDLIFQCGSFAQLPAALQRAFCEKIAFYEGVPQIDIESRIKYLIVFFSNNSVNIDMEAFPYRSSPAKNPTTSFIESSFRVIGVSNILMTISTNQYKEVFENNPSLSYKIYKEFRKNTSQFYKYPFRDCRNELFIAKKINSTSKTSSIWQAFIDDILTRRHKVAHGQTLDNETSWRQLASDVEKVRILMFALLHSACGHHAGRADLKEMQ